MRERSWFGEGASSGMPSLDRFPTEPSCGFTALRVPAFRFPSLLGQWRSPSAYGSLGLTVRASGCPPLTCTSPFPTLSLTSNCSLTPWELTSSRLSDCLGVAPTRWRPHVLCPIESPWRGYSVESHPMSARSEL